MAAPSAIITSSVFIYNGSSAQNGVTDELKPVIGNMVPCSSRIGVVNASVSALGLPFSILPITSTLLSPSVLSSASPNEVSLVLVECSPLDIPFKAA